MLPGLRRWSSGSPIAPDFDLAREAKTGLDLVHAIVEEEYGGTFRLTPERGGTKAEIVLEDVRLHKESQHCSRMATPGGAGKCCAC